MPKLSGNTRREWYVYDYTHELVLIGYDTEWEARKEADRVRSEIADIRVEALPRNHPLVRRYAETHPAWAKREGFASTSSGGQVEVYPEVREGDVGVLTESMMADDTAGFSHRISAGMEVKVARVEPKFIGFHTGDVIEGENYFITPLTLEFRRKFRKRSGGERVDEVAIRILELLKEKGPMTEYEISTELGVPPERVGETTDSLMGKGKIEREPPTGLYKLPSPTRHVCPVCGDAVAGGPEEYLEHIKTKHPEEWRRLETDPSYTLRRTEAGPRQLAPTVRRLPTVTIREKKYYLDARLREYRAVDDPHDRIPLEPEYAKLLGEASEESVAWNAVVESIIEEKQREAEQARTGRAEGPTEAKRIAEVFSRLEDRLKARFPHKTLPQIRYAIYDVSRDMKSAEEWERLEEDVFSKAVRYLETPPRGEAGASKRRSVEKTREALPW